MYRVGHLSGGTPSKQEGGSVVIRMHAGDSVVSVKSSWLLLVSATACFGAAPMGWNSWNSFANIVNSQIVQQQAKALASTNEPSLLSLEG